MISIPAGSFYIGESPENAQDEDEINEQAMAMHAFEISRYPVTNAQFEYFVNGNGYTADHIWWDTAGKQWLLNNPRCEPDSWKHRRFGVVHPNHPVVGVTWYEAIAFCYWLNHYLKDEYLYTLPTEAEWEYAARGSARRTYPWSGDDLDDEHANFDKMFNGTTAVGIFPYGATPEGVHELAGSVWEWTGSSYMPYSHNSSDEQKYVVNSEEKRITIRGGGWPTQSNLLRASFRHYNSPGLHLINLGFRLARHLRNK